jgi:hypothetical protein
MYYYGVGWDGTGADYNNHYWEPNEYYHDMYSGDAGYQAPYGRQAVWDLSLAGTGAEAQGRETESQGRPAGYQSPRYDTDSSSSSSSD